MTTRHRAQGAAAAAVAATALLAGLALPAGASHETGPEAICDGEEVTFWPNAGLWGVKKERGSSTTFIPVAREITAHDLTNDEVYGPFSEAKGNGRAHSNQETVECTFTVHEHEALNPFTGEVVAVDFTITIWAVRRP